MSGTRQPIDLVISKGKKHLTKAEIKERRDSEVQGLTDDIAAPSYLTEAQKKHFNVLADQLQRIKIMAETDNETLARYVVAQELYEAAVKDLRAAQRKKPKGAAVGELITWAALMESLDKRQDRYFKQAHTAASALGLTIASRCKLVLPKAAEPPKENKFAAFGSKMAGAG